MFVTVYPYQFMQTGVGVCHKNINAVQKQKLKGFCEERHNIKKPKDAVHVHGENLNA